MFTIDDINSCQELTIYNQSQRGAAVLFPPAMGSQHAAPFSMVIRARESNMATDDTELSNMVRELSKARTAEKHLDDQIKTSARTLREFVKHVENVFSPAGNMAFDVQLNEIEITPDAIRYKQGYVSREALQDFACQLDDFKSARHIINRLEKKLKDQGLNIGAV